MNIFEVLDYGPIVAHDEEMGILITVNGSYFNFWIGDGQKFRNTECYALSSENGLYGQDITKLMDKAKELIADALNEAENQE